MNAQADEDPQTLRISIDTKAKSWNGYLLDTVHTVLKRAANFVWKGFHAGTRLIEKTYEKGVKVNGKEKAQMEQRLYRSEELPWYDILVLPEQVYQ